MISVLASFCYILRGVYGIFSVFYNDEVLHLTIDNGCTGNIIRLNVVERLNIMMKPTKIKAKLADDKTYLEVVGEIDINLTRGKTSFKFEAIVVTQLGPDILAGTPFMKANDVMTDFVNELVIVQKNTDTHLHRSKQQMVLLIRL